MMKETMVDQIISNLCDSIKKGQLVVLLGSGISKNSGLPLANDLKIHILKNFGLSTTDIDKIIESNFPFEAFMGDILANTDISPILDLFKKGEPNINHTLIARFAKIGLLKTIVTTNFDLLIENALNNEGFKEHKDFMVYYTDEHFAEAINNGISDKISIYKIHGSIIEENSVRTILNELAQCRGSDNFQKLLKFIFSEGRHQIVLILGYSCSDEFDITPIINEITKNKKNIVFVQHSSNIQDKIESIEEKEKNNPFKKFPGIRVYTNTNEFVKKLWFSFKEYLGEYKFLLFENLWEKSIEDWVELQKDKNMHFEIIGDIFSSISIWDKSIEYYKKALNESKIDGTNCHLFAKLGVSYFGSGDLEKSAIFHEQALNFIRNYRDPEHECISYLNVGGPYLGLGNLEKAIGCFEKAQDLALILRNKDLESGINTNLGVANFLLGNSKTALTYFYRDLDILHERGDIGGEALTRIFIGNVHCILKDFEQAQEFYNSAHSTVIPLGSYSLISAYNLGMGILNLNKKNYNVAIDFFNKSLDIDSSVNNRPGASRCCLWLGYAFLGCRKFEESHDWFKKSLDIATNFYYNYEIARCYIGLGKIAYYSNGNAIDYFQSALEISEKYGYKREMSSSLKYLCKLKQDKKKDIASNSHDLGKIGQFYQGDSGNIIPNNIDFEQYGDLIQILRIFYRNGIVGTYSLKKTLLLISEINQPFIWLKTESAEKVDTGSPEYQEMVTIFEEIRNGLLHAPFESKISNIKDQQEVSKNIINQCADHFSAIYDHVLNSRIKWWDLQCYFYYQKKKAEDENFSDVFINLLLIMMITYWVYLWNNALITHNEVVDVLIQNKDPTYLFNYH